MTNCPGKLIIALSTILILGACQPDQEAEHAVNSQSAMPTAQISPPPLPSRLVSRPPPLTNRTADRSPTSAVGGPPPLPPVESKQSTSTHHSLHLRRAQVIDRQGFEKPLAVIDMLIPAEWQARGEVVWQPMTNCQAEVRQFQWQATSSDGLSGIEFLPGRTWESTTIDLTPASGCPQGTIRSIRDYLDELSRQRRPGARVLAYDDISAELRELSAMMQQAVIRMPDFTDRRWADGGRLQLSWLENGREMRETLFAIGVFHEFYWSTGPYYFAGSVPAPMIMAYRAPAEEFDPNMLSYILQTWQIGEEWQRQVAQLEARIAGNAIDEGRKRHAINMDTIAFMGDLNRSSFNQRTSAQERNTERFSQTIRGVQTWTDPSAGGESFELPTGYANAWRLDDDSFIVTDNPNFHPWSDLRLRGRQLQPGGR